MENWNKVYTSKNKLLDINLKEIIEYKDLIFLFVKRDFKTLYKQTILGPLWVILVPIMTTLIQTFVFGNIAGLSTDGIPHFLFYLSGNAVWMYFSDCLTKTADTFISNSAVFGKVYFPRLISPISTVISGLISFGVQFLIFFSVNLFYLSKGLSHLNIYALLFPVLIIELAALSLGCGIIISSLTTKYRDLRVLFNFGIQLWMYVSAIIFPVSVVPEKWQNLIMLNPIVPIVEAFRYGFTGAGNISWPYLCLGFVTIICILTVGILLFNRVEKNFMDTI